MERKRYLELCQQNATNPKSVKVVLDGIEYHFFELPKFRKSDPNLNMQINQWLSLIDTENKEWLEVAMENNDKVKKAINKVDDFMADDEARILIELREKWQLDYNTSIAYAKRKGLQQGIEQGVKQNKHEIAKKLIQKKYDIKDIIEITNLTEEEIKKLI